MNDNSLAIRTQSKASARKRLHFRPDRADQRNVRQSKKATLRLMSVQAVTVSAVVMRLTISCRSNADLNHYGRVVCSAVNHAVGCGVPVVV